MILVDMSEYHKFLKALETVNILNLSPLHRFIRYIHCLLCNHHQPIIQKNHKMWGCSELAPFPETGKLSQVAKTPIFLKTRRTFTISPNCSFHSPIPTFSCTLKDSMQARSINKLNYQKWIDFSWAIHSLTRKYQAILKENLNGASKVIRAVRYKWSKTNAVRDARKFMSRCLECNIPVRNCPSMR